MIVIVIDIVTIIVIIILTHMQSILFAAVLLLYNCFGLLFE